MLSSFILLAGIAHAIPQQDTLTLESKGAVDAKLGYYPAPLPVSETKPEGFSIVKEPTYRAKPQYGVITVGNGPKSKFVFVLDEPTNADFKIYIDKNQNGDLTDDGDGAWNTKRDGDRPMYGVMDVTLRASYGTATEETSSSDYTIGLYRFVRTGNNPVFSYRESSRTGMVTIDGKSHKVLLVENDANGLFNKPVSSVDEAGKTRPIWLKIDLADDGKFSSGTIDARAPFKIGDSAYEAVISDDGSKISIAKTTKPIVELTPKRVEPKPLLKAGSPAPDFVAQKWGGGDLKLSQYKGKIVVLDFWATWCGPCQASMPHIESIYKSVNKKEVVVLGVCVWDEKAAYEKWVPTNKKKYSFQFAFDPAGNDNAKSIASSLFNVSGIPTTYIIDKNGNVADAIVGYDKGDARVEEALKKLGVKIKEPKSNSSKK